MTYGTEGRYIVLDFIRGFVDRKGYSPTYAEISAGVGLSSSSTIHKHLRSLKREGLVGLRRGARKISLRDEITCPNCKHKF